MNCTTRGSTGVIVTRCVLDSHGELTSRDENRPLTVVTNSGVAHRLGAANEREHAACRAVQECRLHCLGSIVCTEYLVIQIFAVAGLQRLSLYQFKGSRSVRSSLGPQESGAVQFLVKNAMRKMI